MLRLAVLILTIFSLSSQTLSAVYHSITNLKSVAVNPQHRVLLSVILKTYDIREIVLSYGLNEESCKPLDDVIFRYFPVPVIVRNYDNNFESMEKQNSQILAIECFAIISDFYANHQQLQALFDYFKKKRTTKILLYIQTSSDEKNLSDLAEIFRIFYSRRYFNVIAVFSEGSYNGVITYYSYRPFPEFKVEHNTYPEVLSIFPNRARNIEKQNLVTLPFQEIPRLLLYENEEGQIAMVGYLGRFLTEFANYINATIAYPYPITVNENVFYGDLEEMAINETIDIAATAMPVVDTESWSRYSYPIENMRYCLMIPVAEPLPLIHILFYLENIGMLIITFVFVLIFSCLFNLRRHQTRSRRVKRSKLQNFSNEAQNKSFLQRIFKHGEYIINDVAIRGVLGQPFVMVPNPELIMKLLYILISLTGLYLGLVYNAYLQTMLTLVPKSEQARTFDDLHVVNKPVCCNKDEWEYINFTPPGLPILQSFATQDEFSARRNNFNTSYSYFVATVSWFSYFNVRQKFLGKDVFIFSNDACIPTLYQGVIPLSEYSIYISTLNAFILDCYAYGIMSFWRQNVVYDMIKQKVISFTDITLDYSEPLVDMYALKWVWLLYAIGMLFSSLIFLIEVLLNKLTSPQ